MIPKPKNNKPINLNQLLKQSGCLGKIKDIHQLIIEDRNNKKK